MNYDIYPPWQCVYFSLGGNGEHLGGLLVALFVRVCVGGGVNTLGNEGEHFPTPVKKQP